MKIDSKTYLVKDKGSIGKIALAIGIVGLVLSFLGYFSNEKQFYFSYLTSFTFWVSLGLGGLFFTMLHHISGAKWSTVILRIPQAVMSVLPLMFIFFIPIIFGINELFEWSSHEALAENSILLGKKLLLIQIFPVISASLIWKSITWRLSEIEVISKRPVLPVRISRTDLSLGLIRSTITWLLFLFQ